MTTALAIISKVIPWLGLAAATWGVACLYSPRHAAVAFGVYILADGWYDAALGVVESFSPAARGPDGKAK